MPIPHSYSSQKYCEPIRLPHTPTQNTTTSNLHPYKHMNKHAYRFMMKLEKYRKAIAISVSALGYNQLNKEQERMFSILFLETMYLQCYQQVLVKVSATLAYLGSLTYFLETQGILLSWWCLP